MRVDPPYDGSPACPMCPIAVRSVTASAFNLLNRTVRIPQHFDAGAAAEKLAELVAVLDHHAAEWAKVTHPDLLAFHAKCVEIAAARPTAETWEPLLPLLQQLLDLEPAVTALSDAHFADSMHSHGFFQSKGMG